MKRSLFVRLSYEDWLYADEWCKEQGLSLVKMKTRCRIDGKPVFYGDKKFTVYFSFRTVKDAGLFKLRFG